ncbi:MAG: hypothetical protein WCU88_10080 [Elusimicrobiota bacterium]|jgi:hypothetical protein
MKDIRLAVLAAAAAGLLTLCARPSNALFGNDSGKSAAETNAPLPGMDEADAAQPPPRMAAENAAESSAAAAPESSAAQNPGSAAAQSPEETSLPGMAASGQMPQEVVIRGEGNSKLKAVKPPLQVKTDPFESLRDSLKPDEQLLLAESPLAVVWRRTHPEFLRNPRVVQPWKNTFSERPGLVFRPREVLAEVLGHKLDPKEPKGYQWSLTIADEEGKVFHHFEGSSNPPEELLWTGQNDQDEWIKAGKAYSPVYMFTDAAGTPYTRAGKPIKYKGVMHQERTGMHLSLDSTAVFGPSKEAQEPRPEAEPLLRSAADLIKRRYPGVPLRVESYAATKELAEQQAQSLQAYLLHELMLLPQDISTDFDRAQFSEQHTEIILLNR